MKDKELLRIIVEHKNNSLIATVHLDESDDREGNFAFAFIAFCESMDLTTKEGFKYLKQNVELWKKYGGVKK